MQLRFSDLTLQIQLHQDLVSGELPTERRAERTAMIGSGVSAFRTVAELSTDFDQRRRRQGGDRSCASQISASQIVEQGRICYGASMMMQLSSAVRSIAPEKEITSRNFLVQHT